MTQVADAQKMNATEQQLLDDALGDDALMLILRTKTRIDSGRWVRRSRIWLCLTDQHLIVLAGSRRQYCQKLAMADAAATWYCHVTGELVIEPGDALRFNRLALLPADALRVIEHTEKANETSQGERASATENANA
jgi:hypothetical protein